MLIRLRCGALGPTCPMRKPTTCRGATRLSTFFSRQHKYKTLVDLGGGTGNSLPVYKVLLQNENEWLNCGRSEKRLESTATATSHKASQHFPGCKTATYDFIYACLPCINYIWRVQFIDLSDSMLHCRNA